MVNKKHLTNRAVIFLSSHLQSFLGVYDMKLRAKYKIRSKG